MPAATPMGIQSPHRTPSNKKITTATTPNISNVVLGNLHIKPWYPSFYPEDLVGGRKADWLYVCQWCFKYTPEIMKFSAHCVGFLSCSAIPRKPQLIECKKACSLKSSPPPGEVIYEHDEYLIHRVDGEDCKLYSQNLSLFAKLFLETKSVFFDASTFLYYTLVLRTPSHPYGQVAGFFSKEKMSWDNNNLACILIFPPWQKRSLGQILIGASYVLGRREGRFGGPERPLSELGRRGYVAYWCAEVARWVLGQKQKKTVSIKEISDGTWIMGEDVVVALKEMDVLEKKTTKAGNVVVCKGKVREWVSKNRVKLEPVVDVDAFVIEDEESLLSEMSE